MCHSAGPKITFDLLFGGHEGVSRGQRDEQAPNLDAGACLACVRDGKVMVTRQC